MFRILLATACVSGALGLAASMSSAASMPTLAGKVGPGYSISLTRSGQKVTRLTAGTYKLVVRDGSASHSFVLEKEKGGTFERDVTSVSFRGTKTLVIKVTRGTYKFYCRPHESMMFGFFTVS